MTSLLIVKPDSPEQAALEVALMGQGYQLFWAGVAEEAVQRAAKNHPDLILMDPALPVMERWHAVKRLMTEDDTKKIPILTLADDAHTPDGLKRLLKKIDKALSKDVSTPEPAPSMDREPTEGFVPDEVTEKPAPIRVARPAPKEEGLILVIDDNDMNRDMLSRRLGRRGYTVDVASSGTEALKAVGLKRYDCLLLDVMMPEVSGIEVLTTLRKTLSATELPIVMATARTQSEDIVEALRLGANDYVTKPFDFEVVLARVRTQLLLRKAHLELKASEARFRALLENTGDMIVQHSAEGVLQYVSPAARLLLGFEPGELVGTSLYDLLHRLDRRVLSQRQSAGQLPSAYTYIARMRRKDGTYLWIETSNRSMLLPALGSAGGDQTVIQAACRDVTEHMEKITGDAPPLPMGGDVMEHPGWRGSGSL